MSSSSRSSAATATCCSTPAPAAARPRCSSSGSCARCSRTGSTSAAILTITFTEKAAAEMRDRIRRRLRELGADEAARATEGAFISTIHGFCARVLRAHALAAGLDPAFAVLDAQDAERLADGAFDDALEELGAGIGTTQRDRPDRGVQRRRPARRDQSVHGELRSRGERRPRLPALAPGARSRRGARRARARRRGRRCAELGADPRSWRQGASGDRAARAAAGRDRRRRALAGGSVTASALPGGNGAALSTDVVRALRRRRSPRSATAAEHRRAARAHELLDRLLRLFGERYARAKRERLGARLRGSRARCRELLRSDAGAPRALPRAVRADHGRRAPGHEPGAARADRADRHAATCSRSATRSSRSTASATPTSSCSSGAASGWPRSGRGRRCDTNFRSRPEILDGDQRRVRARARRAASGRSAPAGTTRPTPTAEPRVELLVADKGADWTMEGLGVAVAGGRGARARGPRGAAARRRHRRRATSCC